MNALVKAFDDLPKLVKIILALPVINIVWHFYRLFRSIDKKSVLGIVLAILLIIIGWSFMWIVDIITIILFDKVLWIN